MSKHTPGPWTVEVGQTQTTIESKFQTVATDVSNNDAELIAAAPMLYETLARICASAPLKGLPLALEIDIQSACALLTKIRGKL
jgi:hypothetical protein